MQNTCEKQELHSKFWLENLKGKVKLWDLGFKWRISLKLIFEKWIVKT